MVSAPVTAVAAFDQKSLFPPFLELQGGGTNTDTDTQTHR